jgi:FkbM family methyltransferase
MKSFELINYSFDEQRIDFRVFHPVKDGYIIAKDIDLDATIYKMKIWDVQPGLHVFFQPTPKHGFDFSREDFGGFTFELIDEGVVLDRIILRFRYTNLYKHKQNINDYYHPSFVNYREFFVDDRYKNFDLSNCEKVIDAGASIGLFTQYILNRGARYVAAIECDDRSIKALIGNFLHDRNITIIGEALSDREDQTALYWKEDNPLISTLDIQHSEFSTFDNPNTKIVQTTTLQNVVNTLGWDKINLLKLDIEGEEWNVINSTSNTIFEITDKILLEYHNSQGRLSSIIERFNSLGFKYQFEDGCDIESENGTVFFFS